MKTVVPCPQCRQDARYDESNPYRPFCSERCKLLDLGAWATEEYRLPAEEQAPPHDMEGHSSVRREDGGQ